MGCEKIRSQNRFCDVGKDEILPKLPITELQVNVPLSPSLDARAIGRRQGRMSSMDAGKTEISAPVSARYALPALS